MSVFTIDSFWKSRISSDQKSSDSPPKGWFKRTASLGTFKEAPLTLSPSFGDTSDPLQTPVILVSAPGAVGKSTLARQIASMTGATYVDLSASDPVGGNTLSGGLVKAGLFDAWRSGQASVLLDGLDEARLRVTQEAFEAFLRDVAEMSVGRDVPTVLFGRTGAIQDAWLVLTDHVPVSVLEIGYYGPDDALDFAYGCVTAATPASPHHEVARRALSLLLEKLRADTGGDGDRFAGYAPVLQAVADRVAQDGNPSALVALVEKGEQPVTLRTVVSAILNREQQKLAGIALENEALRATLYGEDEQLAHLAARLFRQSPPNAPAMSPKDAKSYADALETWVPEHPFLDGGLGTSSAVFEGLITSQALKSQVTAQVALKSELARGAASNPFLSEFYLEDGKELVLPPEHVGIIYASLRARLALGDTASLLVEGVEGADDADEEEALKSDIEITVSRAGRSKTKTLRFESEQTGILRFGNLLEDIEIFAPLADVEIGVGVETVLIAPISIQCAGIKFATERLVIETVPEQSGAAVYLEAGKSSSELLAGVPTIHGDVTLSVAWPNAQAHPWTSFSIQPAAAQDPRLDEGLRRFRKFVIAFRSHSKGALKRFAGKIEHARMTKGVGRAVLDHMVAQGIVSTDGEMYTLHPGPLAEKAGASYLTTMSRNFSPETIKFVETAIS